MVRIHQLIGMCLLFFVPFARPGLAAPATEQVLLPRGEISVPVGAKVGLHIYDIDASGAIRQAAPVLPAPAWMLNGKPPAAVDASEGKLSVDLTLTDATYVAPDQIPPANPVAVAVQLGSPGPGQPRTIWVCNIRITEAANHFVIQAPNQPRLAYHQDDSHAGSTFFTYAQMAVLQGDELSIQISAMNGAAPDFPGGAATMSLIINGSKRGEYKWKINPDQNSDGNPATVSSFNVKQDSGMTTYLSTDCIPHNPSPDKPCTKISLDGTTTITAYDPSSGEVKGYFEGEVVQIKPNSDGPSDTYGFATGQFHARLMGVPGTGNR